MYKSQTKQCSLYTTSILLKDSNIKSDMITVVTSTIQLLVRYKLLVLK